MRLAAALALLLLAGCAAPGRVGLGAADARRPVALDAAPWRSVGAVVTRAGGRCTGALVAPRVAVTAAHCLLDPASARMLPAEDIRFVLGIAPGQAGTALRVATVTVGAGFAARPGPRPDPRVPADSDWALLVLDQAEPAQPSERILALAPGFVRPGVPLALGGYQADGPEVLVADVACAALGYARDPSGRVMLRHSCSATNGSSGGPLLLQLPDGGWAVVGVASMALRGEAGGWAVPAVTIRRAAEGGKPTT